MLWKFNFITILVLNSNTEFERKIENNFFAEADTLDESGLAPCPRDADLKNGSRWKGERALLQNNIKVKPEQLKLSRTYPSTWP
jgi:hypothetical protein